MTPTYNGKSPTVSSLSTHVRRGGPWLLLAVTLLLNVTAGALERR